MREVPKPLNPEEVYLFAIVERLDVLIGLLSPKVEVKEEVEVVRTDEVKRPTRTRKAPVKKE